MNFAAYPAWEERDFVSLGEVHYEIMSSRGCAYRCNFCHNTERRISFFSPKRTVNNIELLFRLGMESIFFVDDIFAASPRHMLDIKAELDRRGISLAGRCMFFTHVNFSNLKTLPVMDAFEPSFVQIGIESGDDDMLRAMGKTFTNDKAFGAIELLRQHGHQIIALFLVGYPGETEASLRRTLAFIDRVRPMLHYVWAEPLPTCSGNTRPRLGSATRSLLPRNGFEPRYHLPRPKPIGGTLTKYRDRMLNATMPHHTILGFFDNNNFRSQCVLEIYSEIVRLSLDVRLHHYDAASPFSCNAVDDFIPARRGRNRSDSSPAPTRWMLAS